MSSELFRIVDTLSLDSDTVALSARQGKILNEKIIGLTLFSISDGLVPLGSIIAIGGVFSGPNNTGVFKSAPSSNNNLAGSGSISLNGFQLCDGTKVSQSANASFTNNYVPNLTDERFLKGSSISGVISGINGINRGDNTIALTNDQLPIHTHGITTSITEQPAVTITSSGTTATAGWHDHSGYTVTAGGHEHLFWRTDRAYLEIEGAWQGRQFCGGNDRIDHWTWGGGGHGHEIYVRPNGDHAHGVTVTGTVPAHNHTISVIAANTGSGIAFDIQPKFLTVNYYMRVR